MESLEIRSLFATSALAIASLGLIVSHAGSVEIVPLSAEVAVSSLPPAYIKDESVLQDNNDEPLVPNTTNPQNFVPRNRAERRAARFGHAATHPYSTKFA